jgi:Yip1 domain
VELAELSKYLDTTRDRISLMHDPDFDPYLPPRAPVGFQSVKAAPTDGIDGNPWLTVWTRPRGTIRRIVDTDPGRNVALLSIIYGMSQTMNRAMQRDLGDQVSLPVLVLTFLIGGSLGGLLWNVMFGALLRWTGSWIGGVATFGETRAALAWGSVPHLPIVLLMVALMAVFGQDLFRSEVANLGTEKGILLVVVGLAQVVLGIWSAVLMVKCLAEVHRFSAWKSLGAFLLAGVLVLVVAVVFVLLGMAFFMVPNAGG